MPLSRCRIAVGTSALALMAYVSPAAAHGVDVTAEIDDTIATLQLTDETGEVCVAIDPAPQSTAVVAIAERSSGDVLLILGEGFGPTSGCQLFDVDIVNGILADVDAHELVIAFGSDEASGVLNKPRLVDPEPAVADTESETNVPLVFGAGLALGIAAVVVRKRFFSKE